MPFGHGATLLELLAERTRLEREAGALKGRLVQVNQKINALAKPQLELAFVREGQPSGTVKFALDNHMFKGEVTKRVEWNSDALKDIAAEISPVLAANLFKTTYAVPEAHFKAVSDPVLKAKLTVARSVKYSEPKITSMENEEV